MSDIAMQLRRLRRLHDVCGGSQNANESQSEPEIDYSKMSQYDAAQYKLVLKMKKFRQTAGELELLGSNASVSRKAEMNNFLRREADTMKKELRECQRLASKDANDRRSYEVLDQHFKATEQLFRKRPADEQGGYGAFSPTSRGVSNVDDLDALPRGSPSLNLREDEEFQQFYQNLTQNDQRIDTALTNVSQGLQRLKENAVLITDSLKEQAILLDEAEQKTDNTAAKLKGLNKKLKETLKKVDSDRMCLYILCCVILLGLAGGIYYIFESNNKK